MAERESVEEFFVENQGRLLVILVVLVVLIAGFVGWSVGRAAPEVTTRVPDSLFDDEDDTAPMSGGMAPWSAPPPTMPSPALETQAAPANPALRGGRTATSDRRSAQDLGADPYDGAPSRAYSEPSQMEAGQPILSPHPNLPVGQPGALRDDFASAQPLSASDLDSVQHWTRPARQSLLSGTIAVYDPYLREGVPDPGARVEVYAADPSWGQSQVLEASGRLSDLMGGRHAIAVVDADENGMFEVADIAPGDYIVGVQSGHVLRRAGDDTTHFCYGERLSIQQNEPVALSHVFGISGQ